MWLAPIRTALGDKKVEDFDVGIDDWIIFGKINVYSNFACTYNIDVISILSMDLICIEPYNPLFLFCFSAQHHPLVRCDSLMHLRRQV
jgi:hypothetical protein